jgi:hypothetical protein
MGRQSALRAAVLVFSLLACVLYSHTHNGLLGREAEAAKQEHAEAKKFLQTMKK